MYVANGKMRCRKTKLTAITGLAIQGGKRGIWDAQLLKIPPVSPSIINCCLIKVDYNIHISLESGIPVDISIDLPIVIGTVPLRSRPPRYTQNESLHYRRPRISPPMLPSYSSLDDLSQDEPPPSYAECISGSVDIRDDDDGDIMGDTLFTPMYTYVNAFELPPPPSYSEVQCHINNSFRN
ncbi:arrestin domain-containing protein-like protein [Dinothrombium tinctorium]|uniref:Arrestin domain-containing protein-like protein n=1 Tax=Dinothrombium tinctorium TaxID=1965070 RepID=A0A443QXI8_9ACAR|nr:arrestin domain-containing protein-like protein [Dinothrombium tinctorium]